MDKVAGCLDSFEPVDTIFLEFAKAFDTVPHRTLILVNWHFTEYLANSFNGLLLGCLTGSRQYASMELSLVGAWF